MKFLFWQFALYAVAAFALGFVAAWSWFRERFRDVETALERTRARVADGQDARHQLLEARTLATNASESLGLLRERFTESETVRVAAEAEVESLRSGRLKLLSEISELRSVLDTATVSRTKLTAAEHEAIRLRGLLDDADEQLRSERVAREQTLSVLKARLSDVEAELAMYRHTPSAVRRLSAAEAAFPAESAKPADHGQLPETQSMNAVAGSDSDTPAAAVLTDRNGSGDALDVTAPIGFNGVAPTAEEESPIGNDGSSSMNGSAPVNGAALVNDSALVNGSGVANGEDGAAVTVYADGTAQIVDLRGEPSPVSSSGE